VHAAAPTPAPATPAPSADITTPPPITTKEFPTTTPEPTEAPPGQPIAAPPPEIQTLAPPSKIAEYHEIDGRTVPCSDGACIDTSSGPAVFVPAPTRTN
jgi:hypothetical protein